MSSLPELPGYTIERELGRGGTARVYLATQDSLGRKVALKLLEQAAAPTGEMAERFDREARTLAGLSHRNIVAIHDIDQSDAGHYLAMEYLAGGSLADRLELSRPPLHESLSLLAQLGGALGHAHAAGIVHRDVKPGNVLFRDASTPVLTDFGIARPLAGNAPRLTGEGLVMGTPAYISPEQIEGQPVDGRADLYALGVVAFELLTGGMPFTGSATEVMAAHLMRKPPDLPPELHALQPVLDRLLAKSPSMRYPDADALVSDCRERLLAAPELLAKLESVPGSSPSERLHVLGFSTTGRHLIAATARQAAQPMPKRSAARKSAGWRIAAGGAVVAALGLAFLTQPLPSSTDSAAPASTTPAERPRLAVLPFENLSPDPANAFFTDGLHDELLIALSRLHAIEVVPRTTMRAIAKRGLTIAEIAATLGASHVMEGSVRREGDRVRLAFQLLDARVDSRVWAEDYDHTLQDALGVQARIATSLADRLQIDLAPEESLALARPPTHSPEAYDLYLQARQDIDLDYFAGDRIHSALQRLDQALTLDPGFTLALCARAMLRLNNYWGGHELETDLVGLARQDIARARELAPDLPQVALAEAYIVYWVEMDYPRALRMVDRLAASSQDEADVLGLQAPILRRMGRFDEAIARFRRASELSPLGYVEQRSLAETLVLAGQHDEALRLVDRHAQPNSEDWWPAQARVHIDGDWAAYLEALQALVSSRPESIPSWARHEMPLWQGRLGDVVPIIMALPDEWLRGPHAGMPYPRALLLAELHAMLGRSDDARAHAGRALDLLAIRPATASSRPAMTAYTAQAHALLGESGIARDRANAAMAMMPPERDALIAPIIVFESLKALAWAGDLDKAMQLLERYDAMPKFASGDLLLINDLIIRHLLGDHPRFEGLEARIRGRVKARGEKWRAAAGESESESI
jgi:serine/threonine protein kinase/TolB-like protein